ncbi:hypothetical protein, partial [Streptomyces sp. NPDC007070]|uniref:hypothetical protein n=1 Tax=Streptomyces sp. NPDC007070 TaxID=3154312 RepID=UPI0033CD83EB
LNTMVGAYVHQSGKPHGVIHTELRRVCGGPPRRRSPGTVDPATPSPGRRPRGCRSADTRPIR